MGNLCGSTPKPPLLNFKLSSNCCNSTKKKRSSKNNNKKRKSQDNNIEIITNAEAVSKEDTKKI